MARLLCVGKEPELLELRCAVLSRSGYDARFALLADAETILRTERFDLIILSAWLQEWETGQILAAAGKTPVLVLTELVLADKLLAQVERLLAPAAHGVPSNHGSPERLAHIRSEE
jgi:DNA-binding response OmpR family regulator